MDGPDEIIHQSMRLRICATLNALASGTRKDSDLYVSDLQINNTGNGGYALQLVLCSFHSGPGEFLLCGLGPAEKTLHCFRWHVGGWCGGGGFFGGVLHGHGFLPCDFLLLIPKVVAHFLEGFALQPTSGSVPLTEGSDGVVLRKLSG